MVRWRRVLEVPLNTCRLADRQIRRLIFEAWDEEPSSESPIIDTAEK